MNIRYPKKIHGGTASGGAVTSTTPSVNYLFVDGSGTAATAKYVRLDRIQYPKNNNGTIGTYIYSYETTDFGTALNRVQYIRDASVNQLQLVQYTWLGINTLTTTVLHPQVSGGLTMNDGSNGNDFINLDRYYRQKTMQWQSTNGTTQFQQLLYTYDRMGNVLTKDNNSAGTGAGNWDEAYQYDGLNRLSGLVPLIQMASNFAPRSSRLHHALTHMMTSLL